MWLITPIGFFSIVQKPDDIKRGTLTVRAQLESDLDNLRSGPLPTLGPTTTHAGTDYAYRASAPKQDVANALAELAMTLNYANFKSEVAKQQGAARAHLYGEVWNNLYQLQNKPQAFKPKTKTTAQPVTARLPEELSSIPKAGSYGGVLVDAQTGKILLREVAGHFGGYVWTYAKGRPDPGETPHQTALREVREETGYTAKIIAALPGVYGGTTVSTSFFIMEPIDEPQSFCKETSAVEWFSFEEAAKRIALTHTATGRARDLQVLVDVEEWLQKGALGA